MTALNRKNDGLVVYEPNGKKWALFVHVDYESYTIGWDGEASPWLLEFVKQLEKDLERERLSIVDNMHRRNV